MTDRLEGVETTASFDQAVSTKITMTLGNEAGTTDVRKQNLIYVYDDTLVTKPQSLSNLAQNFKVSNSCAPSEGALKLLTIQTQRSGVIIRQRNHG
ncbi:hypothetical protein MGH68_17135 [Erysipelothrix sp. D19-032]